MSHEKKGDKMEGGEGKQLLSALKQFIRFSSAAFLRWNDKTHFFLCVMKYWIDIVVAEKKWKMIEREDFKNPASLKFLEIF